MIIRIGWRIVFPIFALNCSYMKAVVQVIQAFAKHRSTATAVDYQVTVGWNVVAEATVNL